MLPRMTSQEGKCALCPFPARSAMIYFVILLTQGALAEEQVGDQDVAKICGWNRDEGIHGEWWNEVIYSESFKGDMKFATGFNSLGMCLQELLEKGNLMKTCSERQLLPSWMGDGQTCAASSCTAQGTCSRRKTQSCPTPEGTADMVSLMQRSKGSKRNRSPTPRRRRIPLRTHTRNDHGSRSWHERREEHRRGGPLRDLAHPAPRPGHLHLGDVVAVHPERTASQRAGWMRESVMRLKW